MRIFTLQADNSCLLVDGTYLIFVMNAVNAVRVKILAECKKIQKNQKNSVFGNFVVIYALSECKIVMT